MSAKEQRLILRCDLCKNSLKPGFLWLGGKDYVECPQCFATRKVEMVEQLITPGKLFAMRG